MERTINTFGQSYRSVLSSVN